MLFAKGKITFSVVEYTEQQWADMRAWVNRWKEVGPILEEFKANELAAMSEEKCRNDVGDALRMGDLWMAQNPFYQRESGMIEQQKIFSRWKPPLV